MDSAAGSVTTGWPIEDEFSVPELGATFSLFTLTVEEGEDIVDKIMSVTGPDQGVCVLVALGGVSSFTIKQPGASSPLVYKEVAQILRLQGLYLPMEKGGPVTGRLKFLGGLVNKRPKSAIEGDVCGRLIAMFTVKVSLGSFKVDFEKLQQVDRGRLLEAAPPILERQRVPPQSKAVNMWYVPYVGGPPPPSPSQLVEVEPPKPRSDWQAMCYSNGMVASGFLAPEVGPLVPPYLLRHPPPPPPLSTPARVEQLERDSVELKDRIQRLEQDKAAMREDIQQLKREAIDREERMKQEFRAMVQRQFTSN